MMQRISSDPLDRTRFPLDEWALTELGFDANRQGQTETLFSIGNGYLGLRGNTDDGLGGVEQATLVNGLCETWPMKHAEAAYGFAKVGQSVLNAPDARTVQITAGGAIASIADAGARKAQRTLDFRTGILTCSFVWRSPDGAEFDIRSRRFVSFVRRHLAVMETVVTPRTDAALTITTQVRNRQDEPRDSGDNDVDPRKGERIDGRVFEPLLAEMTADRAALGFRTSASGMSVVVATAQTLATASTWSAVHRVSDDLAERTFTVDGVAGEPIRLTTFASYHDGTETDVAALAEAASATLNEAGSFAELAEEQAAWLAEYWARTDVEIAEHPALQQAVRWNLLQIAHSSARADGRGIAAKGLSGTGYGGHSFWDTETYVMPLLTYTSPEAARHALAYREQMLPAAQRRAIELDVAGALYPWRTITGDEASAYYPAGTAQFHINADIAHALVQYVRASGDDSMLDAGAIDMLIETARMWVSLGSWRYRGKPSFHIVGVTGPDEYTAVVNDNCYTNISARAHLRDAVTELARMAERNPAAYSATCERLHLTEVEIAEFERVADCMFVPFDAALGVHGQDADFLEKPVWDLANTPASKRPLLLHFHPLVIYRHQVLKQADVVLAMLLYPDEFSAAEKRRNFHYYDAITTGDSTLSAVVQSIVAAEVGAEQLALDYFVSALFTDLADLHRNASDGVHVASAAGIWSGLVFGFAGMRDAGGIVRLDPRLPEAWPSLRFRLTVHGSRVLVTLTHDSILLDITDGDAVSLVVRDTTCIVRPGQPVSIALTSERT